MQDYPRDMKGYGATPPVVSWPGSARIAVQFVINYEEGGENNVLHGDGMRQMRVTTRMWTALVTLTM